MHDTRPISAIIIAIAVIAIGVLASPVLAQTRPQQPPTGPIAEQWWQNSLTDRSRYYNVRADLPPDAAEAIAAHMDLMCDAYSEMLGGFRIRKQFKLDLWLFSSRETYAAVLEHRLDCSTNASRYSAGICVTRGSDIVLASWAGTNDHRAMLPTLQHEGFHQFARAMFPSMPPWANEGVAEVFEAAVVVGDRVILGEMSAGRRQMLLAAADAGRLKRFDDFMRIDGRDWLGHVKDGEGGLNYAQAWALSHFFLYADNAKYQPAFGEFLGAMNRGTGWESAFFAAFGTRDYAAIEQHFIEHLRKTPPTDIRTTLARLEFLAEGSRALAENEIFPETLEALRAALEEIDFRHVVRRDGQMLEVYASDPESFRIPYCDVGEVTSAFRLIAPKEAPEKSKSKRAARRSQGKKQLPRPIFTEGLEPRAFGVKWKRDRRGLTYELVVE